MEKDALEQLREANDALQKDNQRRAKLLAKPLATISSLVAAAKINVDGPDDKRMGRRSHHIRRIIMNW